MDDVRLPIETVRDGSKTTKIVVEDIYKLINRVQNIMDKAYQPSVDICDSFHHEDLKGYEGEFIVGIGVSQPCLTDAYDEEIGSDIAFMKAKLNANIKKHNYVNRIAKAYLTAYRKLCTELFQIDEKILMDLDNLRCYNKDYLTGIEKKLGILNESEE